jgi:hypothetical protein
VCWWFLRPTCRQCNAAADAKRRYKANKGD